MMTLVLAGCGGNGKDEATKPTAPPTTQPRDLQAEVLAAYRANWSAFAAASDPPLPDHPALAETKTGRALAAARRGLEGYRERGLVGRGGAELHPSILSVTPDRGEVEDCVIDQTRTLEGATGRVVAEPNAASQRWKAVLLVVDGRWKTENMTIEGTC